MPTPADDGSTYTLRRVQAMLGLGRGIVTGLIDAGFVTPSRGQRNELRFTFQDLMLLRTAHALQAQGLPPRRILKSLAQLKDRLPAEMPLTGLRITAVGSDIAVRDRRGQWEAGSGQLLMDFDVAPAGGNVTILARQAPPPAEAPDARAVFETAMALESADAPAAESAYLEAVALDPKLEDAWLNLGAMWSAAGRHADLLQLSDTALRHCPQSSLLHFNRAVALDHLARLDEAAAAYESSLALDPRLADAHFNLARLHEQAGDTRGALRHYNAYRRLRS